MNRLFILLVIVLVGCTPPAVEVGEYDEFAQCLSASGVKMYGSFLCSVCKTQRDLFGSSFQYVGEIECHPQGENSQTDLCLSKDVEKTPTWIVEKEGDESKLEGFQSLETLAEVSGCTLG